MNRALTEKGRIESLDGLRAIAILLVISGHASQAYLNDRSALWLVPLINSSLGVRIFFVLSGFLITGLLQKEYELHGTISLRAFYIRRALRIFPAFYLFLAAVGLLAVTGTIKVSIEQYLSAATYTWNYMGTWCRSGPIEGAWFLGHLWTLSLEEQFYLLWPGLVVLAGWKCARWTSLLIPLGLPFVRLTWYFLFPDQRGFLGMMFHTAIDSIMVGCAFALWKDRISTILLSSNIIWVASLVYVFMLSPLLSELLRGYRITVGIGLDALGSGILIIWACGRGLWAKLLSLRPLSLIGTWSYSIYLWQQLFLTPYNSTSSGKMPLSLGATLICALVSYYCLERPILRVKWRFVRTCR